LAQAAALLGIRALICVPGGCSEAIKAAIRARGGEATEVRTVGRFYDEAREEARRLAEEQGLIPVPSSGDPLVDAGGGTLALEMLEEEPELDLILCPLSGGGLASGVASLAGALRPEARVYGVYPRSNPSWPVAWTHGEVLPVEEEESYADALARSASPELFPHLRDRLSGILGVEEEEIGRAMALLFREHRQVVEGAGAIPAAALLAGKIGAEGLRVGLVASGGNPEERVFMEVLRTYRS
jgi:threonine dehydratase